jgi:ABC-type nitrate/sulfonate/bicarbonate transport system substrate-binding protein
MKSKITLRIGGVPEHFNLPWQLALEQDVFSALQAQVSWTYFAGGTGVMTEALSEGDLDIALMLTEGFVSAWHRGLKAKIVKVYTASPLTWGIYSGYANTPLMQGPHELKYAISRKGSGSHLMARIHAQQHHFHPADEQYVEVSNLNNAITSLKNKESNYFYWEKYTSIPSVKKGHLCFLDTFHAPWCGFVVVASEEALREKEEIILKVMEVMNEKCQTFMNDPENIFRVSNRFEISTAAATEWFENTRYQENFEIHADELKAVHESLGLPYEYPFDNLLHNNMVLV